ncbi:hypothetical protein GJ496_007411 [Pomphorhynchus laevis]|nr:hypothetical protein GJ496_007411 [Pomphorhynchus laevis]
MIGNLCRSNQDTRSWIIKTISCNFNLASRIFRFLTVADTLIIISALECVYNLTNSFQDTRASLDQLEKIVNYFLSNCRLIKLLRCFLLNGGGCLPLGSYENTKIIEESTVCNDLSDEDEPRRSILTTIDPNNSIMNRLMRKFEVNPQSYVHLEEVVNELIQIVSACNLKITRTTHYLLCLIHQCFPSAIIDESRGIIIGLQRVQYAQHATSNICSGIYSSNVSSNLKRVYSLKSNESQPLPKRPCVVQIPAVHRSVNEFSNLSAVAKVLRRTTHSDVDIIANSVKFDSNVDNFEIKLILRKLVFDVSCLLAAERQQNTSSTEMRSFLQEHFLSLSRSVQNVQEIPSTEFIKDNSKTIWNKSHVSSWMLRSRIYSEEDTPFYNDSYDNVSLHVRHTLQIIINKLEIQLADNPALAGDRYCRQAFKQLGTVISSLNPNNLATTTPSKYSVQAVPAAMKCSEVSCDIVETAVERIYNQAVDCQINSRSSIDNICQWLSCGRKFALKQELFQHVFNQHINRVNEDICCLWTGCDQTIQRKRWAMASHIQDFHCCGRQSVPDTTCTLYNCNKFVATDVRQRCDGPVSRSIRLLSALICRNISRCSSRARRLLITNRDVLIQCSMESRDSSKILAVLLSELDY